MPAAYGVVLIFQNIGSPDDDGVGARTRRIVYERPYTISVYTVIWREGKRARIIIRSAPYQSLGVQRVTALPRIIGPLIFAASLPGGSRPFLRNRRAISPAQQPPQPVVRARLVAAIDRPAAEGLHGLDEQNG